MVAPYQISHDWEEPQELHELLQAIREQRDDANVRKIRYAYFIAEAAHRGQVRSTGEPYITHPLSVARILVDLRMDDESIVAGLLHDVLEDCEMSGEKIAKEFGEEVLHLVEGVTKLTISPHGELTERQQKAAETTRTAETLRKMLLAMAKDFRVMVIKLADRLHNMQTLESLSPQRKARIANETLDVYAPLAARLGIWQIKWQLEDLSFRHLHPEEFKKVSELVAKSRAQREAELQEVILAIKDKFEVRGIKIVDQNHRGLPDQRAIRELLFDARPSQHRALATTIGMHLIGNLWYQFSGSHAACVDTDTHPSLPPRIISRLSAQATFAGPGGPDQQSATTTLINHKLQACIGFVLRSSDQRAPADLMSLKRPVRKAPKRQIHSLSILP